MAQHIEVNILRHDAENWLGDTTGVDVDATVENYADAVDTAIRAAFPEAEVSVNVLPASVLSTREAVVVDDETDGDAVESVNAILTDVFNGGYEIVLA